MWPFKNENDEQQKVTGAEVVCHAIKRLIEFRRIGETFNYLGRTCIVTGHFRIQYPFGMMPSLSADYADDHGIIREVRFSYGELAGLEKQNAVEDKNDTINDGFGNSWPAKCRCGGDMEVVRPGKVQCGRCG